MNIKEAINVVSALDVKSEYGAIAKEMILSEIDQLTNNWNELEEWLKENEKICKENDNNVAVNFINVVLDKMKEIKEGNNERTTN